ncbi:MAG TPA: hypothetical protein VMS99_01120 [Acidimicrobiia bacterium]|nr:hypothetical protein [Acidimicrobiia bacterium]
MARKMFGVFTAVAAALLLVGVAWASGDRASDDSSSGSFASSGSLVGSGSVTSVSSPSVSSQVTNTSLDDNSSTSTSVDSASTSSTVDNSSTSTTIDDHGGTTNTTIDDHGDKDETRSPAPVNSDPTSYQVGGAGTVTVQIVTGQLVLLDVTATKGWSFEVDKSGGRDIKIEFESGESEAEFEAKLRDGQIRIEVEAKDG